MKNSSLIIGLVLVTISVSGCGLFDSDQKNTPTSQPSTQQPQQPSQSQKQQSQSQPSNQNQQDQVQKNGQEYKQPANNNPNSFTSTEKYRTKTDNSRDIGHYPSK